MSIQIDVENLSRIVDNKKIIDDLSVKFESGKITAILGPSGAGKSSLLRVINRLDEPTFGNIYIDGMDYQNINPRKLRKRVGMVPQKPALREGTVKENVTIGPRLRGEPYDGSRVSELLEKVDLAGYEDRDTDNLSGGEAQRVAIARTMFNEPEALLLDELTSSLDREAEKKVEELLEGMLEEIDRTVILVTHNPEQAKRLADNAVKISDGRIEETGPVEEVVQ